MKARFIAVPLFWALSTFGVAMEQGEVVVLAGQYNMLSADISMIAYDPENVEYLEQADQTYQQVATAMTAWLEQLPEETKAEAEKEWRDLSSQLVGESGYPGLLDGYDLNLDAAQRIHYDALQAVFQQSSELGEGQLDDMQTLYLKLTSVVSGYVSLAANPFGSMAISSNDGDLKLVTLASDVDALFAAVINSASDQSLRDRLRRQQSKWEFVRSTIIKASQSAMPYIVRYQGRQMANELADIMSSAGN